MASTFDLDAYFDRIGYSGDASPALATLQQIHALHTQTIPFENLNPLLGWPVLLDAASLQQKLVRDRRGGYCYEQNLLFRHALEAIGFQPSALAARVVWNVADDVVLPRTHALLRLIIEGEPYIADVGFGGLTLTGPLRLKPNIEQTTPHERFRLIEDGAEFILQADLAGNWKPLYRFTLQEQLLADYEMANWYVSCHPKSRFVNALIAARPDRGRRYALFNNEFAVHYSNGTTEKRVLTSVAEIREALEGPIGLPLPPAPELEARLSRLMSSFERTTA
jgi:N-hydroxyarylamine O-acetyltransferase